MKHAVLFMCLLLASGNSVSQAERELQCRVLAWDKVARLAASTHYPVEQFIVQARTSPNQTEVVRLWHFPTPSVDPAKVSRMPPEFYEPNATWRLRVRLPNSEREVAHCRDTTSGFLPPAKSHGQGDNGKVTASRFRAVDFEGDILLDDLGSLPCYVLVDHLESSD
jgi:hypothetical protein